MPEFRNFQNFRSVGFGRKSTQIITGTAPSLQAVADGATMADALVSWGTEASSADPGGEIVTREMSINGGAWAAYDGATVLAAADTATVRKRVTDGLGSPERTWTSNTITTAGIAPTAATSPVFTGTVAEGETITVAAGTYGGTTPISLVGGLIRNGVDVSDDMVGDTYTIPPGTAGQSLQWIETASNGYPPDAQQSVSATIAAEGDTTAPTFTSFTVGPRNPDYTVPVTADVDPDPSTPYILSVVGLPAGAPAMTDAQKIIAGTDMSDNPAPIAWSRSYSETTLNDLVPIADGLDANYDFYAVVRDAAGNPSVIRGALNVAILTPTVPVIDGVPTITVVTTLTVGETLEFNPASTSGVPDPDTTWQLVRTDIPVEGTVTTPYVMQPDDAGHTLSVIQIETNVAGNDTAESAATGVVAAADVNLFTRTDNQLVETAGLAADVPLSVSVNIGTPNPNRRVIVALINRENQWGAPTWTLRGITLTSHVATTSDRLGVQIVSGIIPDGTTAILEGTPQPTRWWDDGFRALVYVGNDIDFHAAYPAAAFSTVVTRTGINVPEGASLLSVVASDVPVTPSGVTEEEEYTISSSGIVGATGVDHDLAADASKTVSWTTAASSMKSVAVAVFKPTP